MKSTLALIILLCLSGCSTESYVHLQRQGYSGDLLNVSQRCLAMSGFENYTHIDWERSRALDIARNDSLIDVWLGKYITIFISNDSGDWMLRFDARKDYFGDGVNDFIQCIKEEYPGIAIEVESFTGPDFR